MTCMVQNSVPVETGTWACLAQGVAVAGVCVVGIGGPHEMRSRACAPMVCSCDHVASLYSAHFGGLKLNGQVRHNQTRVDEG